MTIEPTTSIQVSADGLSVDDMAERVAKKLGLDRHKRDQLAAEREVITAQIKALDVEIDKADRMTKALIPRHRNSAKKAEVH